MNTKEDDMDDTNEDVAQTIRREFDTFREFNPYPKAIKTTEQRMAMARVAVILASFRNRIGDIGAEADFDLYADISSDHDDTSIPLYLHLAKHPDREVMIWAEEFAAKYRSSLTREPDEEGDFVLSTCRSFYDPLGVTDPEDLEELLADDDEEYN
jgi:hypothetical protein